MPWNNQGGGGGPWGSGTGGGDGNGNNPWGGGRGNSPWGGGRGGGPTPPDLEEMLRRGQDRFRRIMPRGLGGGRGIVLIVGVAVLLWLLTGIYRVQPSPIETVTRPSVTSVNRIDIGFRSAEGRQRAIDEPEESLMLTGDENIIDIDFTVLWRISSARDYLFNVRNPEDTVRIAAESSIREVMGRTDIQPALTEARAQIEQTTRALLQGIIDEYGAGIEIVEVQLQSVDPPAPVVDAFNDVLRARQDLQRLRNEAEAYRNDIIPRARGEAERLIQEASAYRESVINQAQGDAERFLSVLSSYRLAPAVTAQRFYLETIEQVFSGVNKVIIDDDAGGGQGVVPYLPLNELQRRTVSDGQ